MLFFKDHTVPFSKLIKKGVTPPYSSYTKKTPYILNVVQYQGVKILSQSFEFLERSPTLLSRLAGASAMEAPILILI